jgi:hypothetical protein
MMVNRHRWGNNIYRKFLKRRRIKNHRRAGCGQSDETLDRGAGLSYGYSEGQDGNA